jgi:hypothetical protein
MKGVSRVRRNTGWLYNTLYNTWRWMPAAKLNRPVCDDCQRWCEGEQVAVIVLSEPLPQLGNGLHTWYSCAACFPVLSARMEPHLALLALGLEEDGWRG